jgi:PAS domain S-box-containing protein
MGDIMKDDNKTKKQLVDELTELRSQNAALKKSITGNISVELADEEARRYAENIVETVREPLLVLDANLKIVSANRNFYKTFKVTPGETIGSFIYDLGNKQWDIPKLREFLEEVLPEKEAFDDFEVDHTFQDIGHKIMLLNARQIYRKNISAKMILLAIEDITERKQLESLLEESEERYRRLFETASDGIVLLEKREGKITHANPATEKMLGYTKKDIIGHSLQDIGILLDAGDFPTTMQNLNKIGIINYDDVPVKTKSGQHIDTEIYLVDRARLVQCNIRDITERRRAAEALRKSEEKYHWVLNNIADVITVMDMNLRFTYVSPSIMRIRGYTPEEALAQTFEEVMTPESLQIIAKVFEEEMRLEVSGTADPDRIRSVEVEQYRKDGSIVLMENHLSFMRDAAKKPVGIISVSHDITQRRQAEKALNKSKTLLDKTFASMDEAIFILDSNTRRIIACNQATEVIFGFGEKDLIGCNTDFLHVDKLSYDLFGQELFPALDAKGVFRTEFQMRRKDGSIFPTENTVTEILDDSGHRTSVVSVVRDITDRRAAEDKLKRANIFLDSIIENIPNMIFLKDAESLRFVRLNRAGEDLLGYSRDDLLGKSDYDFFPKEQADHFTKKDRDVLNRKEVVDIPEESLQTRTKGERTIHTKKVPLLDAKGEPEFLLGISEDITERKRAEEALQKSESLLQKIFDLLPIGLWLTDKDGKLMRGNPAGVKIWGAEPKVDPAEYGVFKARRLPSGEEIAPEDWALVNTIRERVTVVDEMLEIDAFDGKKKVILNYTSPVLDNYGAIQGAIVVNLDITNLKHAENKLQDTLENLRKVLGATVQAIAVTVETKDPYTAGHQRRVADLARAIATEMNLPADQIDGIRMAATIHDLGKISVPAEILSKPTKLTNVEFSLIQTHSQSGYDILKDIDFPWPIARMILEHHERMDGSGYPNGLMAEAALLESRILAVADVVESMASHRPYRPGLGVDAALEEISKNRGILYDTGAVDACLRLFHEKGYKFN